MKIRLNQRLSGAERDELARQLAEEYADGLSIRELAANSGTSIGRVRRLLAEAGVEFRPRGGATRKR